MKFYLFDAEETYVRWNFFSSTPFNEDSFIGWTCRLCVDILFGYVYFLIHIPPGCFFAAIGLYFRAYAEHFCRIFSDLVHIVDEGATIGRNLKVEDSFVKAINFQNDVKRWTRSLLKSYINSNF